MYPSRANSAQSLSLNRIPSSSSMSGTFSSRWNCDASMDTVPSSTRVASDMAKLRSRSKSCRPANNSGCKCLLSILLESEDERTGQPGCNFAELVALFAWKPLQVLFLLQKSSSRHFLVKFGFPGEEGFGRYCRTTCASFFSLKSMEE